ncbi:MAG: hypothetical protein QM597_08925 [Aeromicrobium sp.]|uniref:hypothetical protein n=1 Tax=Aeromicrobium sp. TaxID=1871063 RepID=UPI0039E617AD
MRSEEIIQAVAAIDVAPDPQTAQAILDWLRSEYEKRQGGTLVGLFARCYLGPPYLDHRLDVLGDRILEHFKEHETPPPPFTSARPFARSDAYAFVEVYDDGAIVPVRHNGDPIL